MKYTADDIKVISWPEPIRNRPGLYLKALGKEGCIALIEEILETILGDKYGCSADEVELRYTRHCEIVIVYSGIGMPVELTMIENISQPTIYRTMMSLSNGAFSQEDYIKYGHLAELGPVFNAACKILRITTIWGINSYSLSFFNGCISSLISENSTVSEMNSLKFVFDSEVMGKFELTDNDFVGIAEKAQSKYQNSNVRYTGKFSK